MLLRLSMAVLQMASKLPITEMEHEKQKEIENTFGQAKNHEKLPESKDTEEDNEENKE